MELSSSSIVGGQIQQPHRHATIDDRRPFEARVAAHTILPRTRKQGQVEGDVSRRRRLQQRSGELVSVFADAAPLAERRTIVEEDAHLCKSFRVSILL